MTHRHVHQPAFLARATRGGGRFVPPQVKFAGLERVLRFGLVIRGIIYFLPGAFALEWALGRAREPMTSIGVIGRIGQQRLGVAFLILIATGLAAYAAWGLVRAISDPVGHGRSFRGMVLRWGYAADTIGYVALLVATLRLLSSSPESNTHGHEWSLDLLARPFGGLLVAAVGLGALLGSGVGQIVTGLRRGFLQELELERMDRHERHWAIALGSVAHVAHGIVSSVVGFMFIAAARHGPSPFGTGLDGALSELANQPFGRVLVALAGLGLMTFGVYSALTSRWMRMRRLTDAVGLTPAVVGIPPVPGRGPHAAPET